VDDFTAWLRQRIQARLALARGTIELGNAEVWTEPSSGVLVTGDDDENHWHGTWAMGDSTLTRLMAANDPRDTIARCEAELAILDEHAPDYLSKYGSPGPPLCRRCITAREGYEELWEGDPYPCRTVRLLGSAYKHQPGYREEWAPSSPA
jgi:hypothetical protein